MKYFLLIFISSAFLFFSIFGRAKNRGSGFNGRNFMMLRLIQDKKRYFPHYLSRRDEKNEKQEGEILHQAYYRCTDKDESGVVAIE